MSGGDQVPASARAVPPEELYKFENEVEEQELEEYEEVEESDSRKKE